MEILRASWLQLRSSGRAANDTAHGVRTVGSIGGPALIHHSFGQSGRSLQAAPRSSYAI
jgi:hypothetical protein